METMTHQQQNEAAWRIEAAQALMGALGLISTLPLCDSPASFDLLKQIPSQVTAFVQSAHLREPSVIQEA